MPGRIGSGCRVSPINCIGDSSIQMTGYSGSNGRLYTSRMCSMAATKSLFCSGGITHPFCFQGLISFFLEPVAPSHVIGHSHSPVQPCDRPASEGTSEKTHPE